MSNVDDDNGIATCSEELSSQLYYLWRISATFGFAVLIFVAGKLWSKVSRLEAKARRQATAVKDSTKQDATVNSIAQQDKETFIDSQKLLSSLEEEEATVPSKLYLAATSEEKTFLENRNNSNSNNLKKRNRFCENCQSSQIIAIPPTNIFGNGSVINSETATEGLLRRRKRSNNEDLYCRIESSNKSVDYQPVYMDQNISQRQSNKNNAAPGSSPSRILKGAGRPPRIESSQLVLNNGDGHVTEIEVGDWSMYDENGGGRVQRQRIKIVTTLDIEIRPNSRENRRQVGGKPIRINIHSFALKEDEDQDHDQNGIDQTDEEKIEEKSNEEEQAVPSVLEVANAHTIEEVVERMENLESVGDIIRHAGLESSNLIFGIDYTASNKFQGQKSFGGKSLHSIEPGILNPYQQVISVLGKTLAPFANSGFIAGYGFGDAKTEDKGVFPICTESGFCTSFSEMLDVYNKVTPNVILSGPTNFAPLIYEAMNICKQVKTYHILVIVADGQVTNELETKEAIVEACKYPLSIIVVGVGDGPWDMMKEFDVSLPKRTWDNFHFVAFHKIISTALHPDLAFSVQALVEIPDQFKKIKALGLLKQE